MGQAIKNKIKFCLGGAFFLGALAILISLGNWQLDRLVLKQKIVGDLEELYASDVTQNIYRFDDLTIKGDLLPFLYGTVQGQFDYSKEILAGPKTFNKQISYQVITPLKLDTGGHVLVSRGFITVGNKDKITDTHLSGSVTVSGLIRQPDWTRFTPQNSPENNVWSRLDIDQIAEAKNIEKTAPVILYAEKVSKEFPLITIQQERWMPRNKHAQYAIFWFTMALAMIGIFGFYARSRLSALKK